MSMRVSFAAVAGAVGTVLFVVGCGQTSSLPTNPSSLVPSASSVSDGRVTAYANGLQAHAASKLGLIRFGGQVNYVVSSVFRSSL